MDQTIDVDTNVKELKVTEDTRITDTRTCPKNGRLQYTNPEKGARKLCWSVASH